MLEDTTSPSYLQLHLHCHTSFTTRSTRPSNTFWSFTSFRSFLTSWSGRSLWSHVSGVTFRSLWTLHTCRSCWSSESHCTWFTFRSDLSLNASWDRLVTQPQAGTQPLRQQER